MTTNVSGYRRVFWSVFVVGAAASIGCDEERQVSDAMGVVGDRRVPFTPNDDVAFIDFFVNHHEDAIAMAMMEDQRGTDVAIKAMAREMASQQMTEIAAMKSARRELTGSDAVPSLPTDGHMEAEMEAMMTLSGAALDRRFLTEMVPHHAAGLPVAHRAVPFLRRQDMRALASQMVEAQSREIGEMKVMLGGTEAPDQHGTEPAPGADQSLIGDRRIPLTPPDDVVFIDFFVSHHKQAIEMADAVIARGAHAEVQTLARTIKAAQEGEIAKMETARMQLTGSAQIPAPPRDPHMESDMAQLMSGTGFDADGLFLRAMIGHHASGLPTAHRVERLQRVDMRALGLDIYNAQAQEIGKMHELLRDITDASGRANRN